MLPVAVTSSLKQTKAHRAISVHTAVFKIALQSNSNANVFSPRNRLLVCGATPFKEVMVPHMSATFGGIKIYDNIWVTLKQPNKKNALLVKFSY